MSATVAVQAALPPAQALAQLLAGAWLAQAIAVAAKVGVADMLKDGPRSPADLAAATGSDAMAMHRILRALAGAGIFEEKPDGTFVLTPLAGPLRSDAPDSIRAYATMTGERWMWQSMGAMDYSLRTGASAFAHLFGASTFDYHAQHPETAQLYTEGLRSIGRGQDAAVVAAYDFSTARTLVDVGGGQGGLLAAILRANLQARGILFDLPHVVQQAQRQLEESGLSERCKTAAGSFFEHVPGGGDIYMLRKVLHDWTDEEALAILRQCRKAIPADARLLVLEMMVPAGNEPAYAKLLDLLMLVHAGGRERTEHEYRDLLAAAGFAVKRIVPTRSALSVVEAVPS